MLYSQLGMLAELGRLCNGMNMNTASTPIRLEVLICLALMAGGCVTPRSLRVTCTEEPKAISPLEQQVFEEVNLARTAPLQFAKLLEQRASSGGIRTVEPNVVEEAINFLNAINPRMPLKLVGCLCLAANDH